MNALPGLATSGARIAIASRSPGFSLCKENTGSSPLEKSRSWRIVTRDLRGSLFQEGIVSPTWSSRLSNPSSAAASAARHQNAFVPLYILCGSPAFCSSNVSPFWTARKDVPPALDEYAAAARIAFGFTGAANAVAVASNQTIQLFFMRAFTVRIARHNSSFEANEIHAASISFSAIIQHARFDCGRPAGCRHDAGRACEELSARSR